MAGIRNLARGVDSGEEFAAAEWNELGDATDNLEHVPSALERQNE